MKTPATNVVVVTRHAALVEYLRELELVGEDCKVISHATPEEIEGKHVIGVLPIALAALAEKVTVVPLNLPAELRGVELGIEEVRAHAGAPETFRVERS